MSFSLALSNGDLVQQGGQLAIVSGVDKLQQDLKCWTAERAGIDRFHPTFGSELESMIGGMVDANTSAEITSEILRVLQNYQALQLVTLKQLPQTLSTSEMLMDVTDITTTVSYDTVSSSVTVANGDRQPVTASVSTGV